MDVLTYRVENLLTLTISSRGRIDELKKDFVRRFGERRVTYRVSEPGDISMSGVDKQPIVDKTEQLPVIFETPNYFFDVVFDKGSGVKPDSPYVRHHLEEVSGRFNCRGLALNGQLSFVNEPGKFRFEIVYERGSAVKSVWLEFLAVSTKMDVIGDYPAILAKVEHEDREMVFSAYAKTVNDAAAKERREAAGDWSWAVYFERAIDEYETALRRIIHEPHKSVVAREDYRRADQLRKWDVGMVREYARYEHDAKRLAGHRFRNARPETTFDTPENRFVKHTLTVIGQWLAEATAAIRPNNRYSEEFKRSLGERTERFTQYVREPVLKGVGRYTAAKGGSLVLQMRPGYAQIRIVWELMHSLFTSDAKVSDARKLSVGFNSLAALYEFWCFIEMRELVDKLLGTSGEWRREEVRPKGLSVAKMLESAMSGEDASDVKAMGYRYFKGADCIAELMFQQSYGPDTQPEEIGFGYARPFYQRPDIVLRVFQGTRSYTYLFDAKYQLEAGADGCDAAPRAALDQMHRYRDAILYRNGRTSRDVVGAYILYPGDEDNALYDYSEILEEQNIGAFPLLPKNSGKLRAHLTGLFAMAMSEADFTAWISEDAIPQRWLEYVKADDEVITDRSIIVAKGYPKDYVKVVRETGVCPWVLPHHLKPDQPRLVLCGSVNGVEQLHLDPTVAPEGPFTKAELLAKYPQFAALEPPPHATARRFPSGAYYVWTLK